MYLVMDIGGTKIDLAWAVVHDQAPFSSNHADIPLEDLPHHTIVLEDRQQLPTGSVGDFGSFAMKFLDNRRPGMVVIGIAGPVTSRKVSLTNLSFALDANLLEQQLECPVILVNDLEAFGWGVSLLNPEDLHVVQAGERKRGNRALIAAGTGLGESILFWDGEEHRPSPSEGGHCTFSPTSPSDLDFMRFMMKRYDHVSWERVVSGIDGFRDIFTYLHHEKLIDISAPVVEEVLAAGPQIGPLITQRAHEGIPWAVKTVEWFVRFYGAEAGNLALKSMALGGVYIGGSIVHHLMPWIDKGIFTEAFLAKGRFRSLMEKIPIRIIKDSQVALKGAAILGHRLVN